MPSKTARKKGKPFVLPSWLEAIEDAFLFPIERIDLQQNQPRSEFDEGIIDRIAKSILENQGKRVGGTGLIHPLLVRWKPGAFDEKGNIKPDARVEVVAGETRYWSGLTAKLTKLPVIITDMTSDEAYDAAVTENILRGDFSEKDEGRMFLYLMNKNGWTEYKLALNVYKDASKEGYIRNRVEMQKLNPVVSRMVDKRPDTMIAARRIQSIKDEDTQRELVDYMLGGGTFKILNEKIREIKGLSPHDKDDSDNRKALKKAFPPKTEEAEETADQSEKNENGSQENGQGGNSSTSEKEKAPASGSSPSSTLSTEQSEPGQNEAERDQNEELSVVERFKSIVAEVKSLAANLDLLDLPLHTRQELREEAEKLNQSLAALKALIEVS